MFPMVSPKTNDAAASAAALEARAKELGVADVFVLAGQVNDLPGWFHGVDVYAMPSALVPRPSSTLGIA